MPFKKDQFCSQEKKEKSLNKEEIIQQINNDFSLQLLPKLTDEELIQTLAAHLNELIQHDFRQLVRMLYRLDVSEPKLKQLLKEHPDADAGKLIAQLIVERQAQKQKSRQQYRQRDEHIPDDEKW